MKNKNFLGLGGNSENEMEKSYRGLIFKNHSFLNFAAYQKAAEKNSANRLTIPLRKIFLPFDFSRYPGKDTQTIHSSDLIEDSNNKVILAGPGYGKTTFMKFLLLNLLEKPVIPVYWEWKTVFSSFENSDDIGAVLTNYFQDIFKSAFKAEDIEAFVHGQQLVFLIDGFDEVEQSGRLPLMKSILKQYREKFPGSYFVIASRIANYPREYIEFFSEKGFQHYKINPLPEHLVSQYINNFINFQLPDDPLKSADKIKFLSKYIETQPGIRALTEHPLLLSLIVLIYTFEGSLPDTKINLYERCIEVLIYAWKKSDSDIRIFNQLYLDNNTLYIMLCEIAHEYFERFIQGKVKRFGVLPGEELKEILKSAYKNLIRRRIQDREVEGVIAKLFNYFKNNTGVIVEISPGEFGFSHLSLLEYLAARHIVREKGDFQGNLEFIAKLLEKQVFKEVEEVILFQVELLGKSTSKQKFVDLLARRLLPTFKQGKNQKILLLLAKLLKDNQEFSINDIKEILKLITISVARNPENIELYTLLNDIFLFSKESREYFVELLGRSTREREIWEIFSQRTAHRIGNKVLGIRGELNILEEEFRKIQKSIVPGKIEEKLNKIKEQIQSLNMILSEYREFASDIKIDLRETDINEFMTELVKRFRKRFPIIKLGYSTNKKNILAFTDKTRIEQILEEFMENSIKHAGVEFLKINLSLEVIEKRFIIHYKDNGKGVPTENKNKIFEPFYSTNSKSTGIGLANVKKIVESLNGEIQEVGKENKGVHFTLSFGISWR